MLASELVKILEEGRVVQRPAEDTLAPEIETVWLSIVKSPRGIRELIHGGFGSALMESKDLLFNLLLEPEIWEEKCF